MAHRTIHPIGLLLLAFLLGACTPSAQGESPVPSVSATASSVPSASASGTPDASVAASPTAEPTATVEPEPEPAELAISSWVETVADRLQVREGPGLASPSSGLLSLGTNATIIAGPIEADAFTWFELASPGFPSGSGCSTAPGVGDILGYCWEFGWVAAAAENGDPWLDVATPSCPPSPPTLEQLAGMPRGLRLACFADEELTVASHVSAEGSEARECLLFTPAHAPDWLGGCHSFTFLQVTATEMESQGIEMDAFLAPEAGSCEFGGRTGPGCPYAQFIGQWIAVTGHYDDPASDTCAETRDGENGMPARDPGYVVYLCRERFVVTNVQAGSAP